MADAVEAGLHGHETYATQLLEQTQALGYDPDATRALMADTGATQALPESQRIPPRTTVAPPPQRRAPARDDRRPASRGRGLKRLAVLLAVILVAIAIILVITQSGGSSNTGPVNSGDVHGQIDGLKQLVQDNAQ